MKKQSGKISTKTKFNDKSVRVKDLINYDQDLIDEEITENITKKTILQLRKKLK